MANLDELLAPFLANMPTAPDDAPELPFSFEPITLPVRAFAANLVGFEKEVASIEAMDAPPLSPISLSALPELGPFAINTCPLAEAGANVTTQLAALMHGLQTLNEEIVEGIEIVWQCALGAHVWENLALIRAGKALFHQHLSENSINVFVLKITAVGKVSDMTEADGYTNVLRLSTQTLCAHIGGVESLYLPQFAKDSEAHADLRARVHQVIEHESLVNNLGAAQRGAFWPTLLAAKLMRAAKDLAVNETDLFNQAGLTLARKRLAIAEGKRVWVGQTQYENAALTIPGPTPTGPIEW